MCAWTISDTSDGSVVVALMTMKSFLHLCSMTSPKASASRVQPWIHSVLLLAPVRIAEHGKVHHLRAGGVHRHFVPVNDVAHGVITHHVERQPGVHERPADVPVVKLLEHERVGVDAVPCENSIEHNNPGRPVLYTVLFFKAGKQQKTSNSA
jgi:hypothetical protein